MYSIVRSINSIWTIYKQFLNSEICLLHKEPRKFLFFDRIEMQVAIFLFLASSRKNFCKWEPVEKNIYRKPLFDINYIMFLPIQTNNYAFLWAFGFSWNQCSRFHFTFLSFFFFFFSTWTVNLLCIDKNHCSCTVAVLFMYCSSTIHALKILKMGPTVFFTHLKIILL